MLDANDKKTFYSIRLLYDTINKASKHVLFWIGAGASKWTGYPLWNELSEEFHSCFVKYDPNYDKSSVSDLLKDQNYPEFFQLCKNINKKLYYSTLTNQFKPRQPNPTYERFINSLAGIEPLNILTTNIDESLEANLKSVSVVQRSDLPRCIDLLHESEPFICKIHGTVSAIESTIFTTQEYANLIADEKYLSLMLHIFASTTVVFIGYGLSDEYVIRLLASSSEIKGLFGDGPHFAIIPTQQADLPENVKGIRYIPIPHKDHRSSIQIVDEIRFASKRDIEIPLFETEGWRSKETVSAHLISDVFPPGTWTSSVTLELLRNDGNTVYATVGNGLTTSELPITQSTAMHDLVVGLVCFDVVYAPIFALSRLHDLLGSELFWMLVREGCLKLIHWELQVGMVFPGKTSVSGGDLGNFEAFNPNRSKISVSEVIRNHLIPAPGKKEDAEKLFDFLESRTEIVTAEREPPITDLVRGLLLRPSIRSLLGMSGGVLLSSIPRWMMFPTLRLANTVKLGLTCQILGIASTKLEFGSSKIAGPAFAAPLSSSFSEEIASYVLSGNFNTDLGKIVLAQPETMHAILKFRDTQTGVVLRQEILKQLSLGYGSDIVATIDGGLNALIPTKVLQHARDQASGMLIAQNPSIRATPAIWNNPVYAEKALSLWKKRAAAELESICNDMKIGPYDPCPCGSGEKLKFCCQETLPKSDHR